MTAAAHAVLTQRLLLSLVASFQRGVPGVAGPLLRRYVADGFVLCELRFDCSWWSSRKRPQAHRISTTLHKAVRPKEKWSEHAMPEAIALYDTNDLHALRVALAATAVAPNPTRARRRLLHRVCEAAAAFGRVDILDWLFADQVFFVPPAVLLSFCVRLAARHNQVGVLEWAEIKFPGVALDSLRDYNVRDVIRRHNVDVLRWMAAHGVGTVPPHSLRFPIQSGDLQVLRVLLDQFHTDKTFDTPRGEVLVKRAVAAGQYNIAEYLVCGKKYGVTTKAIEIAVGRRDLRTTKLLLDHLTGPLDYWVVRQLIGSDDLPVLALLKSAKSCLSLGCTVLSCCYLGRPSNDAVRLLLPLSSVQDTAVALMRFAQRKNWSVVEVIRCETEKELPEVVVDFVDRAQNDSLGPMATNAFHYRTTQDDELLGEILRLVPSSRTSDVQDTVLSLLPGPAHSLTAVLRADAARPLPCCDEEFLQLCLSLRQDERDTHHKAIQSYFHTRKKPKSRPNGEMKSPK